MEPVICKNVRGEGGKGARKGASVPVGRPSPEGLCLGGGGESNNKKMTGILKYTHLSKRCRSIVSVTLTRPSSLPKMIIETATCQTATSETATGPCTQALDGSIRRQSARGASGLVAPSRIGVQAGGTLALMGGSCTHRSKAQSRRDSVQMRRRRPRAPPPSSWIMWDRASVVSLPGTRSDARACARAAAPCMSARRVVMTVTSLNERGL
jgi:hypothetical protein